MSEARKRVLIIGISGVTCGGKTTIARKLHKALPESKLISQDDYYLPVTDPRHVWIKELNHINFDILSSLDMERMYRDVMKLINNRQIVHHSLDQYYQSPDVDMIIIEGFSIFNYKPLLPLFSLTSYLTLKKDECYRRRMTRVYEPPDCPGYFEKCVWPEHLKHLEEVKQIMGIHWLNENVKNPVDSILMDIALIL